MKVTGQNLNISAGQVESNKSEKTGSKTSAALRGNDKLDASSLAESSRVNLSSRAQQMQKAKDIASNDSIDEAKVARLQSLIDSGKYSVDAKAVADRLVDEHLLLPDE